MSDPTLPPHQPVAASSNLPRGFITVDVGDVVRTSDMYFSFYRTPPQWVLSSFFTSDVYVHTGVMSYARPSSWRARLVTLPKVISKCWPRWRHLSF